MSKSMLRVGADFDIPEIFISIMLFVLNYIELT